MNLRSIIIRSIIPAIIAATAAESFRLHRRFECPPAEDIHPCTCVSEPRKQVRCSDVKSLEAVRSALADRFPDPLPSLRITALGSFQLPRDALRDVPAKKLFLDGCNLRRIHDDAFEGQDALGLLSLTEDRLTEFPTEALKRLPGLRSLSLSGNFLLKVTSQSIHPDSRIQFLFLSDNMLSSLERNSFPRTLISLTLSRNLLATLNHSLVHLDRLDTLYASGNRLTTLEGEFRGLPQLTTLGLEGNAIESIDGAFDDTPQLTYLNLAYNELTTVEKGLYPLKRLQHLNISNNYVTKLNDDLFRSLNGITSLDLSGNDIKNVCQSIRPLTLLRVLRLSDMNLKALDYDCLKGMKNLQTLDLSQNSLTSVDAVTGHYFPKLTFLHVQENYLQNFRHGLKNLRNLYELDISSNNIKNLKTHHLMHNTKLNNLIVEDNPWDCSPQLYENFGDLESRGVELIGAPPCYLQRDVKLEENAL